MKKTNNLGFQNDRKAAARSGGRGNNGGTARWNNPDDMSKKIVDVDSDSSSDDMPSLRQSRESRRTFTRDSMLKQSIDKDQIRKIGAGKR